MTTSQIIEQVRSLLGRHTGEEKDLLEALCDEAEGWQDRLSELGGDEE